MRTIGRTSVAVTVAVAATLALAGSAAAQDKSVRSEVLPKGWATAHGARGGATADPDRDGLSNWGEWRSGTRPRAADSDRDGIRDDREDRDGDGLGNAAEVALGTDPRRRDTDADGVTDGAEDADCDGLANAAERATAWGRTLAARPGAGAHVATRARARGARATAGATGRRPACAGTAPLAVRRSHDARTRRTAAPADDQSPVTAPADDIADDEGLDDQGGDDAITDGSIEYVDWTSLIDDAGTGAGAPAGDGSADDEWSDDGTDWGAADDGADPTAGADDAIG